MSTATIKPIETTYKGFRFRSRLEARYAVWLDALRLQWRYEEQGYDLASGRFLPDFWLPDLTCFLEVKPRPLGVNSREYRLCRSLAIESGNEVWMTFDPQIRTEDWESVFRINAAHWTVAGDCRERPLFELLAPWHEEWNAELGPFDVFMERKRCDTAAFNITHGIDSKGHWLVNAFRAFRSARFEHGESGAP